jgi:hypothetical protein
MKSEARLPIDFEPYIDQARELRREYIARILRSGVAALSRSKQGTAKPALFRAKPQDLCSQA